MSDDRPDVSFQRRLDLTRTDPIRLIGGYHCHLTADEANKWHKFVNATPESQELRAVERRLQVLEMMASSGSDVDDVESEATDLVELRDGLMDRLFTIGEQWFTENIANP